MSFIQQGRKGDAEFAMQKKFLAMSFNYSNCHSRN